MAIAHAQLPYIPASGVQGVTTFFVLSGFLITTLLLREREQRGRIDLRAFWGRRALRLLPALIVFVSVTGLFWWLLGMITLNAFIRAVLPVLFYYGNFTRTYGWDVGLGPFPHTWSLAVEEQFYLVWPLFMIVALIVVRRLREPARSIALISTLVAFTVVSAGWRVVVGLSPGPNYNGVHLLPHTTVFSMTAGAAFAVVYTRGWRPGRWVVPASFVAVPGFLLLPKLLGSHYGGWVIGPVFYTLFALLLIAMVCGPSWTLFEFPPIRAIGTVSYGWYLWHMPAMLLVTDPKLHMPHRTASEVAALLFTLGIAGVSWHFIEKPILTRYKTRLERVKVRGQAEAPVPAGEPRPVPATTEQPVPATTEPRPVPAATEQPVPAKGPQPIPAGAGASRLIGLRDTLVPPEHLVPAHEPGTPGAYSRP